MKTLCVFASHSSSWMRKPGEKRIRSQPFPSSPPPQQQRTPGCISVSAVRLSPTPRTGPVSLRLPHSLGGHVLFRAEKVVASEKLWRILLLSDFDVAVHGCVLDAGIDEGTLVPHLWRLLLWSGLAVMQGEEEEEEGEERFEAKLLRRKSSSSSSGSSGGGAKRPRSASASSSAAAADSSADSSDSDQEVISSFVAEEASEVAAAAATAAAAPASSSCVPSSSAASLKKPAPIISFPPPISVPFTARLRCGPAAVHVGRGKLLMLQAAAEVLVGAKEEGKKEEEGRG